MQLVLNLCRVTLCGLALAPSLYAAEALIDDFTGPYSSGGVDQFAPNWKRAFFNGEWFREGVNVQSPPDAQKFRIAVGEIVLPGDSGIGFRDSGGGTNPGNEDLFDLREFAPDIDPTQPWSLTLSVFGHNDSANPNDANSFWRCNFETRAFDNLNVSSAPPLEFNGSNNDTWQQLTYVTGGSSSRDTKGRLFIATHWGAAAAPVLSESRFIFDDLKITYVPDTQPTGPVTSAKAFILNGSNIISWKNPTDVDYAGARVRFRHDQFPTGPTDGTLLGDKPGSPGFGDAMTHNGTNENLTYFYAVFAFDDAGNFAPADTAKAILPPAHAPADFDDDGDVDQSDYGHLQACFSGQGIAQPDAGCADAKLDADSDVDKDDVQIFLDCMSGPNVEPISPSCLPQ